MGFLDWIKKDFKKKSTFHNWLDLFDIKLIRFLINFSVNKEKLKEFEQKIKKSHHKLDIFLDVCEKKEVIDYSFMLKKQK